MDSRSRELNRALEWALPLGVCCAEAQADGIPCTAVAGECFTCERADPLRLVLLRMAREPGTRH
jgi:hypothetical protein